MTDMVAGVVVEGGGDTVAVTMVEGGSARE